NYRDVDVHSTESESSDADEDSNYAVSFGHQSSDDEDVHDDDIHDDEDAVSSNDEDVTDNDIHDDEDAHHAIVDDSLVSVNSITADQIRALE
ncbi:hypothetical protein A2U01_0078736, partial [Trifolium medium]|nr:hypothetical protein [Trifolium medium]